MAPIIERVSESWQICEGPHWDAQTQALYYVDIFGETIHKYIPSTNTHTKAILDAHVSCIIPVEGKSDQFVICSNNQIRTITWDGVSETISKSEQIIEVEAHTSMRFNDGKVDPTGRLWSGTIDNNIPTQQDFNKTTLYSINKNRQIKSHVSDILFSNGLAWSPDLKKFYYADTLAKVIYEFDFDAKNGEVKNQKPLFSLEKHNIKGMPDGQAIDVDGNLWVAIFQGSCIIKIDTRTPETLIETVRFPVKQVTSVAFGGPDLDQLYVTTGRVPIFGDNNLQPPENGALYRIKALGVKGLPGVPFKL